MTTSPQTLLSQWFIQNKRSFPWRKDPSPYTVWVSEIMLQQTRAQVVQEYFNRWMKEFPSLEDLALAPIDKVLKAWEGLGYYSRVRNLKKAAEELYEQKKPIPGTQKELLDIPGIGPYTAGAIASFAFHQKAPAIDGNVIRVLSRYHTLNTCPTSSQGKKILEEKVLAFLPDEKPWIVMEALIELGATICLPRALCAKCPLQTSCQAKLQDTVDIFPIKKKRSKETIYSQKQVFILLHEGKVLLQRNEEGSLLGGLTQFPSESYSHEYMNEELILQNLQIKASWMEDLSSTKQNFTRYVEELIPSIYQVTEPHTPPGFFWEPVALLDTLLFSSGHRRILKEFLQKKLF